MRLRAVCRVLKEVYFKDCSGLMQEWRSEYIAIKWMLLHGERHGKSACSSSPPPPSGSYEESGSNLPFLSQGYSSRF